MIKAFSTGKCDILSSGTHKKPSSRGEKEIEYKLKGNSEDIGSDFAHRQKQNKHFFLQIQDTTQQASNCSTKAFTNMDDGQARPMSSGIFLWAIQKKCVTFQILSILLVRTKFFCTLCIETINICSQLVEFNEKNFDCFVTLLV